MDNLISEYGISTWKIFGGSEGATLSIRFGFPAANGGDNMQVYSKKSQGNIQRDIGRLEKWIDRKHAQFEGTTHDNTLTETKSSIEIARNLDNDNGMDKCSTPVTGLHITHDNTVGAMAFDVSSSQINDCDERISIEREVSLEQDVTSQSQEVSACYVNNMGVSNDMDNANDGNAEPSKHSKTYDMTGQCMGCGCDLSVLEHLYTCTECSSDTDLKGVCCDCNREKAHGQHSGQLCYFTVPADDSALHCCFGCGHLFDKPSEYIYDCEKCDGYVLCLTCSYRKMHKKHSFHNLKVTEYDIR